MKSEGSDCGAVSSEGGESGTKKSQGGKGVEQHGAVGGFSFEAPKFSGVDARDGSFGRFLKDLDTFFVFHKFNDDLKLRFLPLCLTSVARDAFEALPPAERATYKTAEAGLRRLFDQSSSLEAHSRLRELRFDPNTSLNTFVVEFKQLARAAFPGITSEEVFFHSFLMTLPHGYQQQIVASGISTFDGAVEKVRNLIQSERIPTAVRQVTSDQIDRSILEQILRRLEQLESRARVSDDRASVAGGRGADRGRGRAGRSGRPEADPGEGGRRSCFACGSLTHLRRTCPHRRSRCFACGELGHISRVCTRGNGPGHAVVSANPCPRKPR